MAAGAWTRQPACWVEGPVLAPNPVPWGRGQEQCLFPSTSLHGSWSSGPRTELECGPAGRVGNRPQAELGWGASEHTPRPRLWRTPAAALTPSRLLDTFLNTRRLNSRATPWGHFPPATCGLRGVSRAGRRPFGSSVPGAGAQRQGPCILRPSLLGPGHWWGVGCRRPQPRTDTEHKVVVRLVVDFIQDVEHLDGKVRQRAEVRGDALLCLHVSRRGLPRWGGVGARLGAGDAQGAPCCAHGGIRDRTPQA